MDPVQSAIASLLSALRGAAVTPATTPADVPANQLAALKQLVGQDVNLIFLGTGPDGQKLALPSGQVFTAQGAMAYPEGTQLLMRILSGAPGTANLRLQTLAAQPPQPAAILAPLLQGEGAALLERLGQAEPNPELAPLVELFQLLKGGSAAALPERAQLQSALDTLSPAALEALKTALQIPPGASIPAALEAWLTQGAAQAGPSGSFLQDLVQLLKSALDRHPEVPLAPKEALVTWLKHLLGKAAEGAERGAAALAKFQNADAPAALLGKVLTGRGGAPPELPETWEAWIKTSVKALSDPAASPREAPFHAAQAKEGTAFYELPLPWSPQSPLQMWVESDRGGQDKGEREETRTVLLGLKFSRLGETRLGIAKGPAGLQVRVWTEHPELLAATQAKVESELEEISASVDLRILPLQPGPGGFVPSLKSLVTGPTLQVMG